MVWIAKPDIPDTVVLNKYLKFSSLYSISRPAEWWNSSKTAFSSDFVKYADERLSTDSFKKPIHPGMNNDWKEVLFR